MKKLQPVSIVVLILLFVVIAKIYFVHPSFSDENLYYAMGKAISEGQKPYVDFNFVHPPLQIYIFAAMFKLFGTSIPVAKVFPMFASALSALLVFFISRKLFDQKAAFASAILLILTPAFLAFSDQGYGIWEALMFLLLSLYLALQERYAAAGISFAVAIFVRYLAILFFPLMIIVLIYNKVKWKRFITYSAGYAAAFFAISYLIFGFNFIDQTILFQVFAKTNFNLLPKLPFQYLGFGYFSIFLALVSLVIGITKREKLVILFSLYPLVLDIAIFSGFTVIIYHYFIMSLAFLLIAVGKTFFLARDRIIQLGILGIMALSVYHNLPTIDFYQNPAYADHFYEVASYIANNATESDKIFGESSITSYIMFAEDIPIASSYLDSFLSYLIYKDERNVVANLEKERPKFIIDMNGYYESNAVFREYLSSKYEKVATFDGIPTYIIYQRTYMRAS